MALRAHVFAVFAASGNRLTGAEVGIGAVALGGTTVCWLTSLVRDAYD